MQLFESEPPQTERHDQKKQWKPERSLTYWKMETIKSTTMLIHCRFDVAYSEIVFVKPLKSFKTLKFTKDESRN